MKEKVIPEPEKQVETPPPAPAPTIEPALVPAPVQVVSAETSLLDVEPAPVPASTVAPSTVVDLLVEDPPVNRLNGAPPAPVISEPPVVCTCGKILPDGTVKPGTGPHKKLCPMRGKHAGDKQPAPPLQPSPSQVNLEGAATSVTVANYQLMGEAVFDMSISTLTLMLGPEWQPSKPDERTMVTVALAKYFETKKVEDIPPGLMLTLVITAYALPRFTQPSTKGKLVLGWLWFKSKIVPWFVKRPKPAKVT